MGVSDATGCNACSPGKYSNVAGVTASSECDECMNGKYNNEAGKTDCFYVELGHYRAGPTTQIKCAQGWYLTECNQGHCTQSAPCQPGTVGNDPANTACSLCPSGKTSNEGALTCQSCETGKYAAHQGSPNCTNCNKYDRKYSDVEASKECKTCDFGKVSNEKDCADVSINKDLPIPENPSILRSSSKNWTSVQVLWSWPSVLFHPRT